MNSTTIVMKQKMDTNVAMLLGKTAYIMGSLKIVCGNTHLNMGTIIGNDKMDKKFNRLSKR